MEYKIIYNYITTNIIDGRQYIGTHSTNDISDKYLGSGLHLKRAIRVHGRDSFIRDIICVCANIQEAHNNERLFIIKYNTIQPFGYNISPTGGLGIHGCFSEETIQKIRGKAKNRVVSEETREKLRIKRVGRTPSLGMTHSVEFKQNMSIRLVGNTHTLGKKLPSFTEEHRHKIGLKKIGNKNNVGKKRTEQTRLKQRIASPFKKPIIQYDKNMVFIREWESASEAARNLSFLNHSDISACLVGDQKTAKGFIWGYKNIAGN